jgi:hypothetical protein
MDNLVVLEISSPPSQSDSSATLETLQIDGISYKLVNHIPNKRGKTSWIWEHGLELVNSSDLVKLKRFWICRLCYDTGKYILYSLNSTSYANSHLKDTH